MVAIHINANYIFCKSMKNKKEGDMIAAYQQIVNRMRMANLGLKHHRLDKDASTAFNKCIRANGMTHKLVPPGNHRCNLAERVIQTFKHHFISILSGVDDKFPLSLWCHLLVLAELTINLLCQSNVAPKILAYPHVHGQHDHMRKPFAPLGCAVQGHVKPDVCQTRDTHSKARFNIRTSMEHNRGFKVYIVRRRSMRISKTVFFKYNTQQTPKLHLKQYNGHPSHAATDKRPSRKRSTRNQSSRSAT